jgi:positive regulator of sigma E activity
MSKQTEIYHEGIIKSIENNRIEVVILSKSACSACHSKSMCSMSEMKEKIVDIYYFKTNKFKIGDNVQIVMSLSMGNKAILLGYGIPFVLLLSSLIASFNITNNEAISAAITLTVLSFYYLLLAAFRKRLSKTFSFQLKN